MTVIRFALLGNQRFYTKKQTENFELVSRLEIDKMLWYSKLIWFKLNLVLFWAAVAESVSSIGRSDDATQAQSSCLTKLACKLGHWAKDSSEKLPRPAQKWLGDAMKGWGSSGQEEVSSMVPKQFTSSFSNIFNDVDDSSCDSTCYRCIAL